MMKIGRETKNGFLLCLTAVAALLVGGGQDATCAGIVNETFTNSSASGWVLYDSACLTAGSTTLACAATPNNEGNGNGWLRLTSATNNQKASAIYTTPFSSANGIQVQFLYASYGGSGADGVSFYLIDGTTGSPTTGAAGGGLGYSFNTISPIGPGVTNGYAGIGLDEFGNFGNTGYSSSPCFVSATSGIKILGSGNLNTGFNCLASNGTTLTGTRTTANWVRITIAPGATGMVVQWSSDGVSWTTAIPTFNLSGASGQVAIPGTFMMGFSGSTGGSTNYHEIRDLTVGGAVTSSTTLTSNINPSYVGQNVTFTATVSPSAATGTATFWDGSTNLGTGTLSGGVATFATSSLTVGTHPITAIYNGDATYASSTSNTVNQVVNAQITTTTGLTSSLNPSFVGESVTFTATVSPTPDTGTVTFYDGGTPLGSPAVSGGVATFTTSTLTAGNHNITATYNGSVAYAGSTSSILVQQVLPIPVLTLSKTTTEPTAAPNGSLTYNFTYGNSGPGTAYNVTVIETVPAQTQFWVVSDPTHCSQAGGVVTCNFGTLAAGATGSFWVAVGPNAGASGSIVNNNYSISATVRPAGTSLRTPAVAGATVTTPLTATAIPTLSTLGKIAMGLFLAAVGLIVLRRLIV